MTWPATPLTTYVANSTPAIAAADLNAFQTGINGLVNGTFNLQGLTLTTGTPGSVVAPVNGSLITARQVFDAAVPSPNTLSSGEVCRDNALAAAGRFEGTTMGINLLAGFGFHAKSRLTAGEYQLTLQRVPSGPSAQNVVVMGAAQAPAGAMNWTIGLDGSNRPVINIYLAAALDYEFSLGVLVF